MFAHTENPLPNSKIDPLFGAVAEATEEAVYNSLFKATDAAGRDGHFCKALPVNYDMDTGQKIVTPFDTMIFGASEYAKDGLIPIVEITGKEYPWFDRMRGLVDDIFKHARIDTPQGKIPSTNIEVNGELLQLLPRLYSMTGEQKYLDWAHRLADYYLLPGKFVPSRLSDHGCEMATLLVDHSDADRLWGLHKLEANTVRTVLIHTMLHTRNTIARPWRQGLQLGAAPYGDGICIFMKSDSPYQGLLQFDIPRHRIYMGFERDWPRMNAVPEWFTVEPDESHILTAHVIDFLMKTVSQSKDSMLMTDCI